MVVIERILLGKEVREAVGAKFDLLTILRMRLDIFSKEMYILINVFIERQWLRAEEALPF